MPRPIVLNGAELLTPYAGVGMYTLRLIRGLANRNVDYKVLVPREAESALELIPLGCQVWVEGRPPVRNGLATNLYWMDRIAAAAIRGFPDAIFHSPGRFWSWRRPARTAITMHDCIYRRFPEYLGRFLVRRWLAYASEKYVAKADLVFTVSDCSARDLHQLANIPAEKIKVVYPWMEPRFNPDFAGREAARVRSTYGLPKKFFLYVGGYDYRKNVEFLLEAYALARRKSELPPLVLAGTIPARKAPTVCDVPGAMERNGLKAGRDVFLPGFIADCDMPGLYGAGELLVYPSLYEGFGFPPVEAIACGKPVLVADNSSLKEIITTPQNRFSTDDPAILASLLLSAQQDPGQFSSKLESRFTEDYAMAAYLEALRIAFD